MTVSKMTSRLRMLAALSCQEADHTPCSFMLFGGLWKSCGSYAEFVERQAALGLDAFVELPPRPPGLMNDYYNLHGIPVHFDPRVTIREWTEHIPGEKWPVLVKEYQTPAGTLRAEVRRTEDWPRGDHVPFLDDFIVPRSRKFLVAGPADLEPLSFLLAPPSQEEAVQFMSGSQAAVDQARRIDLLLTGGWGVGADLIGWICGLENMVFMVYDRPGFFQDLLNLIARWNQVRMELVLSAGIDLYIKRAWYENLDFFTPASWNKYLLPILKAEADLAHSFGSKFGYLITSSCMPLLESIAEAGVDVLIGVDPQHWDLKLAKEKLAGKVCLWGGVNGHLTVEQGYPGRGARRSPTCDRGPRTGWGFYPLARGQRP